MALLCRAGRPRDAGTRHDQIGIGPNRVGHMRAGTIGQDRPKAALRSRPYRAARPFYCAGSAGGLPFLDMHREEL